MEHENDADARAEQRAREAKAIQAMKQELQLPYDVVAPVLKDLLVAFENEWSHIEADGYRLLADSIFQQQESVANEAGSSRGPKKGKEKHSSSGVARTPPRRKQPRRASKLVVNSDESSDTSGDGEGQQLLRKPTLRLLSAAPISAIPIAAIPALTVATATKSTQTDFEDHEGEPKKASNKLIIPVLRRVSKGGAQPSLPSTEARVQSPSRVTFADTAKAICNKCQGVQPVFDASKVKVELPESGRASSEWIIDPRAAVVWNGNKEAPRFKKATISPLTQGQACMKVPMNEKRKPATTSCLDSPTKRSKVESCASPSVQAKATGGSAECLTQSTPPPVVELAAPKALAAAPTQPAQSSQEVVIYNGTATRVDEEQLRPSSELTEASLDVELELLLNAVIGVHDKSPAGTAAGVDKEQIKTSCELPDPSIRVKLEPLITAVTDFPDDPPADATKQEIAVREVSGNGLGAIAMSYNEHGDSSDSDSESLPQQKQACISVAQTVTASAVLGSNQKMNHVLQTGSELIPVLCLQGGQGNHEVVQTVTASAVLGSDQKMDHVLQMGSELIPALCLQAGQGNHEVAQTVTAFAVLGSDQKMDHVLQTGSELIPVLCLQAGQGNHEAHHTLPTSTDHSHMSNSNGQTIESNGAVLQKNLDIVLHTNPDNREHRGIGGHGKIVSISRHHDHGDISRGKERVSISLVSDLRDEDMPRDFYYIHQTVVYKNAHTDFSLANIGEYDCCRKCTGNCLESPLRCACARVNCGEYAYTTYGCLRGSLIEQELGRKQQNLKSPSSGIWPFERCFIKECWEKCGCTQQCGNRVVQRGIFHRLQVFWTKEGKGWGLRTLEDLPPGTFVCEYVGEILTSLEMKERKVAIQTLGKNTFPLQLDAKWCSKRSIKQEEVYYLDATYYGNVARFINHRCSDTNLLDIPVEIESPDHQYYHVAFFTSKEIKAEEELTWDYGLKFDHKDFPTEAFTCLCGSNFCRGKSWK